MSEQSFEEIYRTYFDPVYRFALTLTREPHAAEELTQETFFKALRGLDRYRGEGSLLTWLCGIAKNAFLSDRRRTAPAPLEEAPEPADPADDPEEAALRREDTDRALRALHALPEPYKEVFCLRAWGGLPFRQIGGLFGKTENWACVVYHRAREKMKGEMED